MRRVVYHVSNQLEWIDVARDLKSSLGWDPAVWFTTSRNEIPVSEALPDALRIDKFRAFRAIPPDWLSPAAIEPPEADLVARLEPHREQYVAMLDRVDPGGAFPVAEREELWAEQIALWVTVLRHADADLVIFSTCPHGPADLALYRVAEALGIPTRIYTPTAIPGRVFVRETLYGQPQGLLDAYSRQTAGELDMPDEISAYLGSLRGDYGSAEPWYMKSQRAPAESGSASKRRSPWRVAMALLKPWKWLRYAKHIASRRRTPEHVGWQAVTMKLPEMPYRDSWMSAEAWHEYRERAALRKSELRAAYEELTAGFAAPAESYVYLPLHYQPERTTNPLGGHYSDQLVLARDLSAALPQGWSLLVREHPTQFNDKLFGEQGRRPEDYAALAATPGVVLVPLSVDPFELLDESRAVATVTGTAGWEGVVRGIPALVFGAAWYRGCDGVFSCTCTGEAKDALAQICEGYEVSSHSVDAFAAAVAEYGCRADLNGSLPREIAPTQTENAHELSGCMIRNESTRTEEVHR